MKRIIIGSIVAVLSIFLLVGYSIFSVFDVTQGQLRRMELVITTASATKYYDGTPLSKPEWELKSGNLREGDTMFVTMSSSITDFGVVQNEIGVTIIDKDQINVTNNYVITYELGFLTINKRPLSIKTDSAYKVYDGTPLTRNFYEVTSGTIPEDHEMLVSMPTVLTEPGEVTNDIHITILNKDGVDVTKNFYMTYELGTLKMDSRPLFVETESLSKVYDGLELFGGYPILKNEILPNHYITIVKSTSIIEASSKTNETIVQITDEFGNDVSRFYDIQYNFGELRIDKRIIQLRTMSAEKPYDTTPLFAHGFDVLYGNLVLDHYFDIVYKNSITTPGSVDNEIDVKIMDGLGNYVTNNYSIEIEKGTLTIYKFTIFISTDSYQKYYDGISLEGGIPTVIGEFIEGHYYLITRRTEVIDAGYYDNVADITVFNEFGSDVTHYYDINYTYGTLTIYERPIRIRTKSASKAYDGLPLVAHEFELVEGTLVDGHSLNTSFIGLIIEPGIVDNEVVVQIIDYNNQYVTSNYLIEYDFGYLEVYRIQLTIVTESITKYYDGLPVNGGDPILMNELLPNHQFEVTYRTEVIDAGYYTNISNIRIYDENYRDVMHFYEINELFGSIVINQRPITIKTSSAEKSYDGLPLTSNQYEIISGDLIENHYLDVNFYQSITEPGFVMNSVIVNVKNMNGNIITNNYSISFIEGTLTVYKIPLTITTGDFSKVYDGLPLNGGSISLSGQLLPNHYFVETHRSNPVDAGDYLNEVTINIYDQDGKNVTNVYDITKELGQLSIYKRPITVKTLSAEKPYDGTPLYLYEYEIMSGSLVNNDIFDVNYYSSIVEPGEVTNDAIFTIIDEFGNNKTNNYQINYLFGTLKIYPITLTIITEDFSKIYDGTPINVGEPTIIGTLLDNHYYEVTYYTNVIEVGTYENKIELKIVDIYGNDVSNAYNFIEYFSLLTIYQRPITVKTLSAEKPYDGTPLYLHEYEIMSGSLVNNDIFDVNYYSSIVEPGEVTNDAGFIIIDEFGNNKTNNYQINYLFGKLKIYPIPLTIITEDFSKIYDGTPINVGEPIIIGTLLDNHYHEVTYYTNVIKVGTYENIVEVKIYDENNSNVTNKYQFTYMFGNLSILQRELIVQTESKSKKYDGLPLIEQNYTINENNLLEEHKIETTYISEIIEPGTKNNIIILKIVDNQGIDVTFNYDIKYHYGNLEILKRDIYLTTLDAKKIYDGTPLYHPYYEVILNELLPGHYLDVIMNSNITEPGVIRNNIFIIVNDEYGNDVSKYYDIKIDLGELKVLPIEIVIRSASDNKVYDGTPLTNPNWEILSGEILPEHQLVVYVDGSITEVGKINNLAYAIVYDENGQDVSKFYNFEYAFGELTILVNIYSGDNISTDSVPDDDTVYLKLNSSKSGTVYLRDKSYGNYNGKGWEEANPYLGSIGVHPLSFVSQTLLHSNFIEETVSIEYVKDKLPYYLPYYTTNYLNGSNDVHYYGPNQTIHNHTYIPFDYLENTSSLVVPSDVEIAEMVYRTYVYQTYLDLPNMTKDALARIAQQNGLSDESSTLIEDIQEYIQNAATYDKDFGPMPKNVDDIVIYFLEIHKKGICQHFAAAATLMYRYFGIPARYVVGFVANAQKDTWVEVDGNKAHAWVEVYIDGKGWVIVEVTPGNGFGGDIGDEEDGNIKPKISVRPHNVIAPYEIGKTISATEVTISGLDFYLNMGYTYTYTLSGALSSPGKSYSEVASFTIYDPDMKDVTSEFNIQKNKGLLQLYLHEINLVTSSGTKVYDGSPLYKHEYHIEGTLGYNHQVRYIEFVSEITNVGRMLNRASIIIEDEMGRDVTELYYINTYYGELIITPRYIVIKSADATKIFDGLPLINNNFEIIEGSIVLGDELQVVITGIQSSIGSSENIIESITIYKNGIEITYNYEIDIELGLLIVRPF